MVRQVDHDALLEFVRKRRKATGGYGATPRLPATILDTFQAVAIRLVLGEETPSPQAEPALAEYLARMLAVPWLGIETTFRLLLTCRVCGLALAGERVRAHLVARLARDTSLAAGYYGSRIFREILGAEPDYLGSGRSLLLPAPCAVEDAARYLFVKKMDGQPVADAGELLAWLQRTQNGDGGFGFFPGTTSFIENCHAALAALSILGARPLDFESARAFVMSCQTGRGGFARSPKAAPFLDASWHGIASLRLLEGMEARPAGGLPESSGWESRLLLSV
ncbi:MAG: prenyltransferase/squalene oxidase repeat-containing protein [Desulfurivibrionaceae bacterium]